MGKIGGAVEVKVFMKKYIKKFKMVMRKMFMRKNCKFNVRKIECYCGTC